jgi:hypothetical protein
MKCHCERSEAISSLNAIENRDCFGIQRLAMTIFSNISEVSENYMDE